MAQCRGVSCACRVDGDGDHIFVTGTGTSQDPFVITNDLALNTVNSLSVQLTKTGAGTVAEPWVLTAAFASTSKLGQLGDVNVAAPTNGYVVAWSASAGKFVLQAPTTATAGSILHGNGLVGNGAIGSPLDVALATDSFLEVTADGLRLTPDAQQGLVRRFADDAERTTLDPAPDVNALTMLDTEPGRPYFWDGSDHAALMQVEGHVNIGGAVAPLSGDYDGRPVTVLTKTLLESADADGTVTLLSADDLADFSGVLSVSVTPTGTDVPWVMMVVPATDSVGGIVYRVDDGSLFAGAGVTASVFAVVY